MKRNLICIVCPIGCEMEVTIDENGIINVVGNNCPRGQKYALTECENPERVITTTILCNNGKVLPVKTSRPIPKDKIFDCMKIINENICQLPVSIGDVIISDVFGANIISSKNMEE
jgi:CxxC motif-containing protein